MAVQLLDGFDLGAVLQPIPGDVPAGSDLREDFSPASPYFRLRDARAEARDAERQSESSGEDAPVPVQWRIVQALAVEVLARSSKDLEVASWLTESLVRAAGLVGLATGATVLAGLVETFWDGLYPMPDEDGVETRVGPVAGLSGQGYDGTLLQPLRRLAMFARPDGTPFGLWQYEMTVELAGVLDPARRAQRIAAGTLPFDEMEKEARLAGAAHWSAQRALVAGAIEAWAAMSAALDARAGTDSPSTGRVRDLLQLMAEVCARFAPVQAEAAEQETVAGATAGDGPADAATTGAAQPAGRPAGPIASREQALEALSAIAAWFRRHEPHSPLAYTLDEAVRRGRMSWPELLDELMPDEAGRHALLTSLGIRPVVPDAE